MQQIGGLGWYNCSFIVLIVFPDKLLDRPENDSCLSSNRLGLPDGLTGATHPAFPAADFSDLQCNFAGGSRALWYSFTALNDAQVTAIVSEYELSLVLSVFRGSCGSLTCEKHIGPKLIPNPDPSTVLSQPFFIVPTDVKFSVTAGAQYFLAISGEAGYQNSFRLDVTVSASSSKFEVQASIVQTYSQYEFF